MRRATLAITCAFALIGCNPPVEGGQKPEQRQSPSGPSSTFVTAANQFAGGETRAAIVGKVGTPDIDNVNCSKDIECRRKFFSLKYCFPDKTTCSKMVEYFLNRDDQLFQIQSDFPSITSRSFAKYQPSWLQQDAATPNPH